MEIHMNYCHHKARTIQILKRSEVINIEGAVKHECILLPSSLFSKYQGFSSNGYMVELIYIIKRFEI